MSKSKEDLFDMIGCIGKDNITGFEGLIIGMLDHLHGCSHYYVQPTNLVDGKVVDPEGFDVQRIKFVKRLVKDPIVIRSKINLGNEVKDTITGTKGIVIGIFTSMYGDTPRISIQPKECKNGVPVESLRIPEPRARVILNEKPTSERRAGAGGPSSKFIDSHPYVR